MVGISPTGMLEKVGKRLSPQQEYEYAYRFGAFLAEYIVGKFGKEKYLEFYRKTCANKLYRYDNGEPLIQNGSVVSGVRQRDIIIHALRSVGIDPGDAEQGLDSVMKAGTVGVRNG